jgi:2-dehydropantoate 2-reductase
MKILIFGRGVIGTLYGWALEKAGHSVEFYVRPGRAAEYGSVLPLKFTMPEPNSRVNWSKRIGPFACGKTFPPITTTSSS